EEGSIRTGRRSRGLQYLTEVTRVHACTLPGVNRGSEIRMVEHVVQVRAYAERHTLRDFEVLVNRQIRVEESRSDVLIADLIGEGAQIVCRAEPRCYQASLAILIASSLSSSHNL